LHKIKLIVLYVQSYPRAGNGFKKTQNRKFECHSRMIQER